MSIFSAIFNMARTSYISMRW